VLEITKRPRIFKLKSLNGEIHFIVQERYTKGKNYDEAEAIAVTKKEASKPLLLLREE
jgi:hypothetical protein